MLQVIEFYAFLHVIFNGKNIKCMDRDIIFFFL